MCATFVAPFVGNEALADLVYEKKWEHRFLHIVRRQDVVPRLLIATPESEYPPTSCSQQLAVRGWSCLGGGTYMHTF